MKKIAGILLLVSMFLPLHSATKKPQRGQVAPPAEAAIPEGYTQDMLATYHYTEGIKALYIGRDLASALRELDRAIEIDSLHAPAYYEASLASEMLDPARALAYIEKAVAIDPEQIWYAGRRAKLLIVNERYDDAMAAYQRLIEKSPRDPEYYGMLALLYINRREVDKALELLDRAETMLGANEALLSYRRDILLEAGRFDEAERQTQKLIESYPYEYDNYLALARIYSEQGKDSLARENYRLALELNPDGVDVLAAMNDYYKAQGDNLNFLSTARQLFSNADIDFETKERFFTNIISDRGLYRDYYHAIRDLAKIIYDSYPGKMEAIELYARVHFDKGEREEGLNIYKSNLRGGEADKETDKELYTRIIGLETYLKRADSVARYTSLALKRFPGDSDLLYQKASAFSFLEMPAQAEQAYKEALKYTRTDSLKSSILTSMADLYYKEGKKSLSYKTYDKALKLDSDNIMALNNYAYFLSEEGVKLDKALKMAEKVMKSDPDNATYIDTYGWIFYKMGNYEAASKYLKQAVTLDSRGSAEILLHYGDVLYAKGDYFMAAFYWRQAQKAGYDEAEIAKRMKQVEKK